MKVAHPLACTLVLLTLAVPAFAQDTQAAAPAPAPTLASMAAVSPESGNFFKLVSGDFRHFFSKDTGQVMSMFAVASIAAVPWDRDNARNGFNISPRLLDPGNTIGGVGFQAAFALGTYGFGAMTHHTKAAEVGRDLLRAQLVSQVMVQGLKFTVRRPRPDGSNSQSFPSGHSASAFATASVLQRHFGWKAGVPAYALGVYVASARMAWNKHHVSDVVMGAGLGIAAGRTVTMNLGGAKFGLGVAPTVGGAQITFTKKQ
ncbi:MAG: phosphatase PAP2 family protein [Vicinamibacterales bacterium]